MTMTKSTVRERYRAIRAEHAAEHGGLHASQAIIQARSAATSSEWHERADALASNERAEWTVNVDGDALRFVATIESDGDFDYDHYGKLSTQWEPGAYDRTEGGTVHLDRNEYRYVVPDIDVAEERDWWSGCRHDRDCAARRCWKRQRDALVAVCNGEQRVVNVDVVVYHDATDVRLGSNCIGGCDIGHDTSHADVVRYLAESLQDVAGEAEAEATATLANLRAVDD